jgi:hypothetical protein
MKLFRMLSLLPPLVLALACAGPQVSVNHDYDRRADFASLRGYGWLPQPARDGFLDVRVRAAVDQQLAAKGYARWPIEPDFFVAYHVVARDRVEVEERGYGYGRLGRTTRVSRSTEGTLILDVIHARTMQVLWRGHASGTLDPEASPEERDRRMNDAVARLLAAFPNARPLAALR